MCDDKESCSAGVVPAEGLPQAPASVHACAGGGARCHWQRMLQDSSIFDAKAA